MVKKVIVLTMSALLLAGCVSKSEKGTKIGTESFQVYKTKTILRNGDFKREPFFGGENPLFWTPNYFKNPMTGQKEVLSRYSLKDGVLTMKAPATITYMCADITPVAANEFELSFKAKINSGKLNCNVIYRTRPSYGRRTALMNKAIVPNQKMTSYKYKIKLPENTTFGFLQVAFGSVGKSGNSQLTDVLLKPVNPKDKTNAKTVIIGDTPLCGIVLPEKHSFYELEAARYLRKYLYVGFGKYYNIFIAPKGISAKNKGMIFVGGEFLDKAIREQIKEGGYAILPEGESIITGGNAGNDDGAIHGAFALLRKLGMEFFSLKDFTEPETAKLNIKKTLIENPAFALRGILDNSKLPYCSLGQSHSRLSNTNYGYDLGTWLFGSCHPTGLLLNPYVYFDKHPEYYALNPTLKRRTWKAVSKHHTEKTMFTQLCYSNPEVQKVVAENIIKYLDACPQIKDFKFCFGDRHGPSNWCACEKCQKFADNDTDRWLKFINKVAERVHKKYPDVEISFLTYAETWAPRRKSVKPAEGVKAEYCMSFKEWSCKNHFKCKKNRLNGCEKHFAHWLEDFKGAPRVVGLYAPTMPGGILYPWATKLREFKKLGIKDIFTYGRRWNWDDYLRDYVLSRLSWNPERNVDSLIDKFVNFYYGPEAGKYVADYIKMVETRDQARSEVFPHPQLMNYAFLRDAERLLGKAIALTKDSDKRKALERSLFKLRHLYIDTCNKGNGLRGKQLKAFSHTLAEVLKFCIKNKVKRLKFNTSYRKYLRSVALVDIGDYEPWYKSPVVKKIIANPEETVGKELKAGNLVPDGIQFITMNLPGGELITDYKAETVRPFIRVLRRASSPNSELRIPFELKNAPEKGATLVVEGLDCEKPERNANMAIRINGIFVAHHKPNKFKKDEWSKVRFKIKPGILKKGINTLRIYNTTMEKADEVYTEVAGVDMANYYWGWFAISDIKLHLPKK